VHKARLPTGRAHCVGPAVGLAISMGCLLRAPSTAGCLPSSSPPTLLFLGAPSKP
jgi:hypothetical protein